MMPIFTNEPAHDESFIEAVLLEDEVLNEQLAFKFVKKDDVPEDFKKFASKLVGELEEACGKKKLAGTGIFSASMAQSFGIRFGKVKEKIEKKAPKNCYTVFVPYKGILNAVGEKPKALDNFFGNPKLMKEYVESCFKKAGMKKVSGKLGAWDGYWKQGKDCIYAADCCVQTGDGCTIYIRCILDTPGNKEVLAGGKRFAEAGIFEESYFLNEGKQAEEYLKKKMKEEYYNSSSSDESDYNAKRRLEAKAKNPENMDRLKKAHDKYVDNLVGNNAKATLKQRRGENPEYEQKRSWKLVDNKAKAIDAIDNHMRKHPEAYKESGIFAESTFIEDDWA